MPLRVRSIAPRGGDSISINNFSVLVGSNNCGKSQTLRDIREYITSGVTDRLKILERIELELPGEEEALSNLRLLPHPSPGHTRYLGVACDLQNRHEFGPPNDWVKAQFAQMPVTQRHLLANMGQYWVAHLDAEGRFRIAAPAESYDTRRESPANAMQAFFDEGRSALDELRVAFREAFGMDIALDWAAMRQLYLKVGRDFGNIPDGREELDRLLRDSEDLASQGDGFRSFAGVALAMLTFPSRLLLLDEPEAFLHPAQARVLGRWLAWYSKKRAAQVIVASHSADFLWGIVSADADASIIRLNRSADGTRFHAVPAETIRGLAQSPLLSSQPVLDSLFHRGVAVCEGDPDRAIYQTIAHALPPESSSESVLFIHSNGKDSIKTPVDLLRKAGAPVCAVVDFDVLNSERVLSEIITALTGKPPEQSVLELREKISRYVESKPETELLNELLEGVKAWQAKTHDDIRTARRLLVASARQGAKWDPIKQTGTEGFAGDCRADVVALLSALQAIGLFVVPCGQLESWIKLPLSKGQKWNRAVLELLHQRKGPAPLNDFVEAIVQYLVPKIVATA